MKLLIYSANLGNFDKPQDHDDQELPEGIDQIDYWKCTDEDFPPRFNSMTPRLQARIVKMTAWMMKPDYDFYLWVDASCKLKEGGAEWFFEQLDNADMALFRHNKRSTVGEEAEYLRQRLIDEKEGRKKSYILPRYENERLDAQMEAVNPDGELFATTAFIYRNTPAVRDCLTLWWLHTSLYHSIDQLSLSKVLDDAQINYNVIDEDYLACPYLEYTR